MTSEERLIPARPDGGGEGKPPWAPRVPWLWILFGVGAITLFFGSYWLRQQQKADVLRTSIVEAYDQRIEPAAKRYRAFRRQLEGWIMDAARTEELETYVDPRLEISGLHGARGLYARIREENAEDPESIAYAMARWTPDAITRCLGLAPGSARTFYETGAFLTTDYIDAIRDETSLARLEVMDDELRRRFERDLPAVLEALRADYFLLAVVRGDDRSEDPVDVYLWNLRGEESLLLRVRAKARGALLPVRIAPGGGDVPAPKINAGGAVDCSIAAQVKAAAGEPALEVGSAVEALQGRDEDAGGDAAAGEGAASDAAPTPDGEGAAGGDTAPPAEAAPGADAPAEPTAATD